MTEGSGERSWWQTLPGMLTAAATLITAVTGLIVALHQFFPSGDSGSQTSTVTPGSGGGGDGAGTSASTITGETLDVGGTPVHVRVTMPSGRTARLGDSRYDVLGVRASAGNPGELMLAFRVRLTNGSRYDANFFGSSFRLAAGADTSSATNFVDDLVPGGATKVEPIDFTVPASTRRATLLVGNDPAKAVHLLVRLTPKS